MVLTASSGKELKKQQDEISRSSFFAHSLRSAYYSIENITTRNGTDYGIYEFAWFCWLGETLTILLHSFLYSMSHLFFNGRIKGSHKISQTQRTCLSGHL